MTGFVILALLVAAISIGLEVGHRRRTDRAGGPIGAAAPGDADRRRIADELRAVAQRTAGPARRRSAPRRRVGQDAVSIRTKTSSSV